VGFLLPGDRQLPAMLIKKPDHLLEPTGRLYSGVFGKQAPECPPENHGNPPSFSGKDTPVGDTRAKASTKERRRESHLILCPQLCRGRQHKFFYPTPGKRVRAVVDGHRIKKTYVASRKARYGESAGSL
jgi:hypothetical protein